MQVEIQVPAEVPVMTLPNAVLFPQAIMPLHIFESRYRRMLHDVLHGDRLFAVANLNQSLATDGQHFEPLFDTATLGLVRICKQNSDGTSNLAIQGLARVHVNGIIREAPYRLISITPLLSTPGGEPVELDNLRSHVCSLIDHHAEIDPDMPESFLDFLQAIDDPDIFADLSAYSLCGDTPVKQHLLETLNTAERLRAFSEWLTRRNREGDLIAGLESHFDGDASLN